MPDALSQKYSDWDKKAKAMADEVDAEEKAAPKNEAEGPTIAKAQAERKELSGHSDERAQLIADLEARSVTITKPEEVDKCVGKAAKVVGVTGGRFVLPPRVSKVFVERCTDVTVVCSDVVTKTAELHRCTNCRLEYDSMGTTQADDCTGCELVCLAGRDQLGDVYFAHSTLELWAEGTKVGAIEAEVQSICRVTPGGLETEPVGRLENEFPSTLNAAKGTKAGKAEVKTDKEEAARFKAKGTDAFRANDFMQAAALYTQASSLDPTEPGPLLNRSQCWLKLGDPQKALDDAVACLELDPKLVKAHFRKGMSLHAMKRYGEAIQAFVEAEKIEPKNKQVQDGIKMAQLMARKEAAGA